MPRVMSQGRMEEVSVSWERLIVVTGEGVVEKEDEKDEMNIEDLEEVKKDL